MKIIGGKWKVIILWNLVDGTHRFGELKRKLAGITQKMLTQELRALERDKLVKRRVYAQVPPKVEYSLTKKGESLRKVLYDLCDWGQENS
jgi:DNA-binding HxlR family transcriptional regulator